VTIDIHQVTDNRAHTAERIIHSTDSVPCLIEPIYRTAESPNLRDCMPKQSSNNKVADLIDLVKEAEIDELQKDSGAEPPNALARKFAEWTLLDTPQFKIPDRIAASIQGGIAMIFYAGDKYADIECFNTGEILGTIATGDGEPDIWTIRPSEIKTSLEKIGRHLAP
jgi:hypothetical protein